MQPDNTGTHSTRRVYFNSIQQGFTHAAQYARTLMLHSMPG
jgi:hypothetical protein